MSPYLVDAKMVVALLFLIATVRNVDGDKDPFRVGLGISRSLQRRCQTDQDCVETLGIGWRCLDQTCHLEKNKRRNVQIRGIKEILIYTI